MSTMESGISCMGKNKLANTVEGGYYYLGLETKVHLWCGDLETCQKMMGHWQEKEHHGWRRNMVRILLTLKKVSCTMKFGMVIDFQISHGFGTQMLSGFYQQNALKTIVMV